MDTEKFKSIHNAPAPLSMLLNSSESVYGFAAWLSCRQERTVFGRTCDCAQIAELVKEFCETNNLPKVREGWTSRLMHPKEVLERRIIGG